MLKWCTKAVDRVAVKGTLFHEVNNATSLTVKPLYKQFEWLAELVA